MTAVAEQHYLQSGFPKDRLLGLAVTRHGYAQPTQHIPVIEAGHPVPDQTGIDATERTLLLADQAGIDDLLLVLLSGGASANWIAPAPGLALADKQAIDARIVALRRQHRGGQHRAQASLAH